MNLSICPQCHVGRLQRRAMTYVQWHGDNLLVVNKMPAVVCDFCGEQIYDDRAVDHLNQLLWSNFDSVPSPHSPNLT